MEARGEAKQVLLNNIIRVRDQAIIVTEVMAGEMGGPRFVKVRVEMRVTSIAGHYLPLATASHQITIIHEFKYGRTPSATDNKRIVSSPADRADIELEFGTCISVGLTTLGHKVP
jgi:hypothetical protein